MFLLVQAYPVVPDKRPLNGCACVRACVTVTSVVLFMSEMLIP